MLANVKNEAFFLRLVEAGRLLIRPDGTILNTITLKVYTRKTAKGQIQVAAKDQGRVRHILASRLVYLAIKGPLLPDEQVMHIDGVKWNNRPSNLEKTDNAGNVQHAYDIGLASGKRISAGLMSFYDSTLMHNSKLSHPQVIEMRNRFAAGESRYRLAKDYKMCWRDVARIIAGEAYRAVKPATISKAH